METLLISGGLLRPNGFELGEGKYYGCAKLLSLDTSTGQVETLLSIDRGNDNFPSEYPNLEFTAMAVDGNVLWIPTDTEIRQYSYPDLELLKTYSHKCFHNIHSVAVRENRLFVTSTGLDMVVVLDKDTGEIVDQINAEGKETWHRFSPEIDYRKLHSTRPHDCHPNYVFWIENQPWVTRCTQEDAVNLHDNSQRIDISGPNKSISVHDGIVAGDFVYFTSVDAYIIVADIRTLEIVETINLNSVRGYGQVRGWCRGLFVKNDILYLGFSLLRKTRHLDKIKWLKPLLRNREVSETCSVLAFDISSRTIVGDYPIKDTDISAIYSITHKP
ncbi:MAG: hypothetical protein OEZ43_08355 [Gammaproteobacteria bacterium]|nr:hypothetical protein [Gammaproteobacteria bacterium]